MPEGPEVETVRVGLLPIKGHRIVDVKVADHKKYKVQKSRILNLRQSVVTDIHRRGKFLIFYFRNNDNDIAALNHLGMTGVWYHYSNQMWKEFDEPFEEYPHYKVYFRFDDGSHLLFVNVRTFGRFEILTPLEIEEHPSISSLGPDILDEEFNVEEFIKRMRGKGNKSRTKEVGKCLLDYTIVAGCGNIYKSEACYLSGIHPMTPTNELSNGQLEILGNNLSLVAKKAFKFKGSSLRDYKQVDGYSGLMQNEFKVYGRKDELCFECNQKILAAKQGDRTSFWCPKCQDNFSYGE